MGIMPLSHRCLESSHLTHRTHSHWLICNVMVMSKQLERCVHFQWYTYLQQYDHLRFTWPAVCLQVVLPATQQKLPCWKCCLTHIQQPMLVTFLSLIDLNTAFNSVDYQILMSDCGILLEFVDALWTGCHRTCLNVHRFIIQCYFSVIMASCKGLS